MTVTDRDGSGSLRTINDIWVEARGDQGHGVLLIAGLGDPAEAWSLQLDHFAPTHRVAAYDHRGVGRSPAPDTGRTVAEMAADAAEVMDAVGLETAQVIGFSGGSAIAQELALSRPDRVDSMVLIGTWARADRMMRATFESWRWMAERAPDARSFFEAFFVWVYTARAHDSGLVARLVDEAVAFGHPQSIEDFHRQLDAFVAHDTLDRLHRVDVPTLVVSGALDLICPPRHGRSVATAIPDARFVLLADEAHQPMQEAPDRFHGLVHEFWGGLTR